MDVECYSRESSRERPLDDRRTTTSTVEVTAISERLCSGQMGTQTGPAEIQVSLERVPQGSAQYNSLPSFSRLPDSARWQGPWLQTQLTLSIGLGVFSVLVFSLLRTRYTLLFAPRTKLKGFAPSDGQGYDSHRFLGWILPTLRASDFSVLQIVGLDACVLLNFLRMSFFFFSAASLAAVAVLVPFNLKVNGTVDSPEEPDDDNSTTTLFSSMASNLFALDHSHKAPTNSTGPPTFLEILTDPTTSLSLHLIFTYVFSLLALYFLYRNYQRFVKNRQLFSLELVHSISARTVLCENLPKHLRGDRALADYFEDIGWGVESVSVCRELGGLSGLLEQRTEALLALEQAWVSFVGNPSTVPSYDPTSSTPSLAQSPPPSTDETGPPKPRLEIPGKTRPVIREGGRWWAFWRRKVDEIDHWQGRFEKADEAVRRKRKVGRFRATGGAFVTFENMVHAQTATQVVHAPQPSECLTMQAPEPRDIVWPNVGKSESNRWVRDAFVMGLMGGVLLFWIAPVSLLAALLSYREIERVAPWLAKIIDLSPRIRAFVQTTLPSTALIFFNALIPFFLEWISYIQGFQARSWIEYSLLKKYHLFLLISVIFFFNISQSYFTLLLDFSGSPIKVPERIAQSLSTGAARHFFMSYVVLSGVGLMPLQLLNLGTIGSLAFYRAFYTRTPRDFAELNAPPSLNYGTVYPQAILIFTITLMYSVISPLILPFGAAYFGFAYLVYKYKLLTVFYKPYESSGQAWPITFNRLLVGVLLFQTLQLGLFLLRESFIIASCMLPLMLGTVLWSWQVSKVFQPLSEHVSLSLVSEVQRGEAAENVMRLPTPQDEQVTRSQTNLNRRRYAINQEDLYLAPADDRTDYSQPPMGGYYPGVLNTGRRRYAHPALAGTLPTPWLPLKAGDFLSQSDVPHGPDSKRSHYSVVLSLRRKVSRLREAIPGRTNSEPLFKDRFKPSSSGTSPFSPVQEPLNASGERSYFTRGASGDEANPWVSDNGGGAAGSSRPQPSPGRPARTKPQHRLSFDPATGVIMLSSEDEGSEEDEEGTSTPEQEDTVPYAGDDSPLLASRYTPYYPHPERRRTISRPTAPPAGLVVPPPAIKSVAGPSKTPASAK